MHPAPSVILFTVLSGLGFGLLAVLGAGLASPTGAAAFLHWGLGYGLAVSGLLASTFHLGNPRRALRAFSQWRTSWLSREAWASVAALLASAPTAALAVFDDQPGSGFGLLGAALCLLTVFCTAMIYAQLRTVPRWNHWSTPALFLLFALTGGAILGGFRVAGLFLSLVLAVALLLAFRAGDRRFALHGGDLAAATGLGGAHAQLRVFAPSHTAGNYVMREMVHVVGRRHRRRLRAIAVTAGALVPAAILAVAPSHWVAFGAVAGLHLVGALAQRWLFFAEAEHVVGHYFGRAAA